MRWQKRAKAAIFFMQIWGADCDKIAIENPVGFMNGAFRKPDQIIEPYYFAETEQDAVTKKTCLWLKNLPPLMRTSYEYVPKKFGKDKKYCWTDFYHGAKLRSKTFEGIAKAMAEQWG